MHSLVERRRREAAERVKAAFLETERCAEEAAILGARFMLLMLEERSRNKLPIETGADALELVAEGISHAGKAFAAYAKAHPHLRQVPENIGITNFGTSESEKNEPFTSAKLATVDTSKAA